MRQWGEPDEPSGNLPALIAALAFLIIVTIALIALWRAG